MYLSRNYKVACPTSSVFAQSDQESPLIPRFRSFPARERYKYILLWVHAMSSSIYIILLCMCIVCTLKTENNYYTMCILFYRVIFLSSIGILHHTRYNGILNIRGIIHQYPIGSSNSLNILGNISLRKYTKFRYFKILLFSS